MNLRRRLVGPLGVALLATGCAGTEAAAPAPSPAAVTSAPTSSQPPASSAVAPAVPAPSESTVAPVAPPQVMPPEAVLAANARYEDPAEQLLRSINRFDTGPAPKQVLYTPDGTQMWATLLGGEGVQIFDAATGEELAQVQLGDEGGAVEVIFTADGQTAYVSQMETATVWEVDVESRDVRRSLDTEGTWTKVLALSPDEGTLYAANWSSNDVSVIDVAEWEVLRTLPTVSTPRGLYPTSDGESLYVAGFDEGDIAKIDLDSGDQEILLRTGGAMRHMVGNDETGRLYVDDMATFKVHVVDLETDEVSTLGKVDEYPNTMDLSADGRLLFVSCRGRNNSETFYIPGPEWGSVVVLDAATGRPLDAVVAGNQTTGLDLSPDGQFLAASDFLDDRMRVFSVPPVQTLLVSDGGYWGDHKKALKK